MRTTVTLDPDVERLLKKTAHKRGTSFKVVLNEAVRQSLGPKKKASRPVLLPPFSSKLRAGLDWGKLSEIADDLEVEAHLAVTRRLLKARKTSGRDHS
jgi:hypothetical protein